MASDLRQRAAETPVFSRSNLPKSGSQGGIWLESLPTPAPWSKLSWGFFLPLVFAGNVIVAILAWFIVELVTR
jgi:hypothetical protein